MCHVFSCVGALILLVCVYSTDAGAVVIFDSSACCVPLFVSVFSGINGSMWAAVTPQCNSHSIRLQARSRIMSCSSLCLMR